MGWSIGQNKDNRPDWDLGGFLGLVPITFPKLQPTDKFYTAAAKFGKVRSVYLRVVGRCQTLLESKAKSVKPINRCKSVIQTIALYIEIKAKKNTRGITFTIISE